MRYLWILSVLPGCIFLSGFRDVVCGNGIVEPSEDCDDHNSLEEDGCSAACKQEPGFTCPNPGEACVPDEPDPICGDGIINPPEECDDGANNSDILPDACRSDCTSASCGDGIVDTAEQCDDGNAIIGDGCSLCLLSACGDGLVEPGEFCYGSQQEITFGGTAFSVVADDIDLDGDVDLAVAVAGLDQVAIFRNPGNGVFPNQPSQTIGVGDEPRSLIFADLDGDGDNGLITANLNSDNLSFLENNNPQFTFFTSLAVGDGPESIAVADFDLDGEQDFAVAHQNNAQLRVFLNIPGTAVAFTSTNFVTGGFPESIATGDLDLDGFSDLVIARDPTTGSGVDIFFNNSQGGFGTAIPLDFGTKRPNAIAIGDIDGDQIPDIVTANNADSVSVLFANGTGSFFSLEILVGTNPEGVAIGDLDGDADLDIVSANNGSSDLTIVQNDAGVLTPVATLQTCSGGQEMTVADLNGDTLLDLAVACSGGGNAISIILSAP